jgi:beta-N-acetylhexosaminidase
MRTVLAAAVMLAFMLQPLGSSPVAGQSPQPETASQILQRMTPEERVGQLFLLTFRGAAPRADDPIYDLIVEGHVSGVMLRARNDNFADSPDTLETARALIASLQSAEYGASLEPATPETGGGSPQAPAYVPLFIAVSQEGDGSPFSEILSGLTDIPSEMAIGATWDPDLAEGVGQVLGRELEALGVNMLLGPSLDVIEDPRPEGPGDLGVRTFGGDPYWVSLMGEAYIAGVHDGSNGRIAVIENAPAAGDRPLEKWRPSASRWRICSGSARPVRVTAGTRARRPDHRWAARAHPLPGLSGQHPLHHSPVSLTQAFDMTSPEPWATWRAGGGDHQRPRPRAIQLL